MNLLQSQPKPITCYHVGDGGELAVVVKANDFPTHSGETSVLVLMNDGRAEELDTVIGEKCDLRTCSKVSDGRGASWSRDHPEGQSEEWILVGERFWGRMSKMWASV